MINVNIKKSNEYKFIPIYYKLEGYAHSNNFKYYRIDMNDYDINILHDLCIGIKNKFQKKKMAFWYHQSDVKIYTIYDFYEKSNIEFQIISLKDDYYLLNCRYGYNYTDEYYKCDGIDSVCELLRNIIIYGT